jgi:WD40 repeat protein
MAPEQAAGQQLDARADVYAAGVVLAEMVSPEGIKSYETRQSVWEGVRSEPAKVPDSPWAPVIQKAVKKDREGRFNSAHTLTRALEDVTLRVEGADDLHPYPGLASFTEDNAEYFFGREAEVEQMWRKLEGPPRMLAIMGPSGAGKSSFIAAGLVPNAPPDWGIIQTSPGNAAFTSLRSALTPELTHRPELLQALVTGADDPDVIVNAVAGWREGKSGALIIVDQFEELFTLNPAGTQSELAGLLRRLVLEVDAHILLSMRDDFAGSCNAHEPLQSIFQDMTFVNPPSGANLRRALIRPAQKCGYRFEDDELVDEMLAEVEGERGALPLLAFAAARLWEKRDRDTGLLTRQAYEDIGGVGGALAGHAEATIDHIGHERLPIVRELFRNLVTAEGTRAIREWYELLSVFDTTGVGRAGINPAPTKEGATVKTGVAPGSTSVGEGFIPSPTAAEEVLRALIDARLLTSYEVREEDSEPTRRVEIIHESLLANWPRLVRWQTQDQEGAQIRDELRQAARAWDEHDRRDDRLWIGTSYREYQLWRERYPGGLSEAEEAFATAMGVYANRRRRRRRLAVAAAFITLLIVLGVVGNFWRRSVLETLRAAASELVAFGQVELENYPTATVAYAIASLERSDTSTARLLALEALWRGPTAMIVNDDRTFLGQFTSDGRWLVQARSTTAMTPLRLIREDGSNWVLEHTQGGQAARREMGRASGFIGLRGWDKEGTYSQASVWSAPEQRMLVEARYEFGAVRSWDIALRSDQRRMVVAIRGDNGRVSIDSLGFDGETTRLGTIGLNLEVDGEWLVGMNRRGRWIAASTGHDVFLIEVGDDGLSEPRYLGRQETPVTTVDMLEGGQFVATADAQCRIRLWDPQSAESPIELQGPPSRCVLESITEAEDYFWAFSFKKSGRMDQFWIWSLESGLPELIRQYDYGDWGYYWLNASHLVRTGPGPVTRIWAISAPADAEPLFLRRGKLSGVGGARFHPDGSWVSVPDDNGLILWPLVRPYPAVIRRHSHMVTDLDFGPGGRWLASSSNDGTVRMTPLVGSAPAPGRALLAESDNRFYGLAVSPDGSSLLATTGRGFRLSTVEAEGPAEVTEVQPKDAGLAVDPAFSPSGLLVAAASFNLEPALRKIGVWKASSGEQIAQFAVGESRNLASPRFTDEDHILALDTTGLEKWNIQDGSSTLQVPGSFQRYAASDDSSRVLLLEASTEVEPGRAVFVDLELGTTTHLESHGNRVVAVALNGKGSIAITADSDGSIRIGPVTGQEPHVLFRHEARIEVLAVDPEERWVASGDLEGVIRLWPMPDLTKPPLHTLPREELIAKLKTLSNLRVVRDPDSPTGWKLTHDPFPGWETVPEW